MGETELGFPLQEQSFPKRFSRFDPAIAHALLQAEAAVLGCVAFKLFAGREHTQAYFEPVTFFPLRTQEGAVDFGQDDFPLGEITRRDHPVAEDRLLKFIFFEHNLGSGFLNPAIQAAVVDGRFHQSAEQV